MSTDSFSASLPAISAFDLLFETAPDAAVLVENGVFAACNQAALVSLGHSEKSQLLEKSVGELASLLASSDKTFEWEFQRENGEVFPAQVSLSVIQTLNEPIYQLLWRDISIQKQLERELCDAKSNYRTILDASRDVIFVMDMESGTVIDANRRACDIHGYSVAEFQQKGLSTLISDEPPYDGRAAFEYVLKAIQGEPQVFEWLNVSRDGQRRWGEVSLVKVTIDGQERILSCAHDIMERKQHEAMLLHRAEQVQRFQTALVKLAKSDKTDLSAALQLITQIDSEALEIGRVSVWLFDETKTEMVCQNLYRSDSKQHSCGLSLNAKDYPRYFEALQGKRAIAASDALNDPLTSEFKTWYLEPLGIASMLDIPIWREGHMVGIICHEHIGTARVWSVEEIDFAASVSDMVSLALEASERQRIAGELRVSEARFRTLFEQFPFSIQILSPEGETLKVNCAWEELFGLKLSDMQGVNLLEEEQLQHQATLTPMQRGFAGEATTIPEMFFDPALTFPDGRSVGSPSWIQAFVCPVKDTIGQISEVILTHQNISEQKQAQEELQSAHEELEFRVAERTRELADANAALIEENAERLRVEGELQRKTSELEAIFEASPDLYFQLDAQGRVLAYHASRTSALYVPPKMFLGQRLQDVLPDSVGGRLIAALDEVLASGTSSCLEYDLPFEEKVGNFEARLMPVKDGRVIAIVRDITQRKEDEAALRHSEEHFRSLIENALDVITILDSDGIVSYESPSVERAIGFMPAELVGKRASDMVHRDDIGAMLSMWKPILERPGTTHTGEFRHLHRDGSWRVLECIGTTLSPTSPTEGIVINSRDVTRRKVAEVALRETEALKASILEVALDAIITIDHEGRVIEFNPVAEHIFGFKRAEVVGQEMAALIVPPEFRDAHHHGIRHYLRTGEGVALNTRIEVEGMRKDGSRFPMELAVRPILTPGEPMFTSYIRDITRQKEDEEALRQAKEEAERANAAKSEFLGRMSHELRTPMNSILGFSQVLARKVEPQQQKNVNHILKAGHHLLQLINEVLDIARIESNKMQISSEPVRVRHIVEETLNLIQPLAAERGCEVENRIPETDDFYVLADRQRLTQVLLNIISNAVKYGGERNVTLSCRAVEENRLCIEISDRGPGLSPDQIARLFNPFDRLGAEQTQTEGTGLGLAISKGLIKVMGGDIGVVSAIGEGCTFWIELALVESPQQRLARAEGAVHALANHLLAGKNSTVLYIEDNLANFSLVEEILADRTHISLLSAPQGQMGLQMARDHSPDLILLDLHLPDISGQEVLARLRSDARTKNVPVVIISANATGDHIEAALEAGAQNYLTKPLDVDELLRTLDLLLEIKLA